jgi:hypothetical protein
VAIEALYVVQFGDVALGGRYRPGGVVVLKANRIFGGDSGYYYVGEYSADGNSLQGGLKIVKHDPTAQDAFGDRRASFNITVRLAMGDGRMEGQMELVDRPGVQLPLRMIWKEDLP